MRRTRGICARAPGICASIDILLSRVHVIAREREREKKGGKKGWREREGEGKRERSLAAKF